MRSAAVLAAGVFLSVVMIVVAAAHIRVEVQLSLEQSLYRFVSLAGYAAEQPYARCRQGRLCAAADPAANQSICFECGEYTGQSAMAAPVRAGDFRRHYLAILHVINFKLFCTAKMLENLAVFIGYCNSHDSISFYLPILLTVLALKVVHTL